MEGDRTKASLSGRRVLVTGAGGFIGSRLCERLVEIGAEVRVLVRYTSDGDAGWLDRSPIRGEIDVRRGDLADRDSVLDAVRDREIVFHLGALIAIPYSYLAPESYVRTNILGTLNVLQTVRELGVARLIHTSTSEVYGTARYVPIDEAHPLQGQSPYSASKIGADQMALSFHAAFGTPVTVCRPFNTYGPRQSARAVIPTIITQIAAGAEELKLGALAPTRDFNHVSDTVRAFAALAACDAAVGQTVNVGSGFEISIGDTAALIAELMGARPRIVEDGQRLRPALSEVERLWADASLMTRLTGWAPAYGGRDGFRRGLEDTIAWFRQPENLSAYNAERYVL